LQTRYAKVCCRAGDRYLWRQSLAVVSNNKCRQRSSKMVIRSCDGLLTGHPGRDGSRGPRVRSRDPRTGPADPGDPELGPVLGIPETVPGNSGPVPGNPRDQSRVPGSPGPLWPRLARQVLTVRQIARAGLSDSVWTGHGSDQAGPNRPRPAPASPDLGCSNLHEKFRADPNRFGFWASPASPGRPGGSGPVSVQTDWAGSI
jgi:hypothetical protein